MDFPSILPSFKDGQRHRSGAEDNSLDILPVGEFERLSGLSCSTKIQWAIQILVLRYVKPVNLYRSMKSKLSTNFERCSNPFPYAVHSFYGTKALTLSWGFFFLTSLVQKNCRTTQQPIYGRLKTSLQIEHFTLQLRG